MTLESRRLMPEGLSFAINALRNHDLVTSVEVETTKYYYAIATINRDYLPSVTAYIADVYLLTASDIVEIIAQYPEVDSVVVISNWDHYTDRAKEEARINNIGVFSLHEFLRALNFYGQEYLAVGAANEIE